MSSLNWREACRALVIGVFFAALFVFILLVAGCSSTTAPTKIVEKEVPSPCIIQIEEVQCAPLPEYPPFPEEAGEAELKMWSVAIRTTSKRREALQAACIEGLQSQIQHNNSLEPRCEAP